MSLGERLKQERERLGMSQPKFAAIAATTKQTLFSWESGRTAPDGFQLAAIATAGADIRYIVTGERDGPAPEVLSVDERELLALYRAASLTGKMSAVGALQGAMSAQPKARQVFNAEVGSSTNVEGNLKQEGISFFKGKRQKK